MVLFSFLIPSLLHVILSSNVFGDENPKRNVCVYELLTVLSAEVHTVCSPSKNTQRDKKLNGNKHNQDLSDLSPATNLKRSGRYVHELHSSQKYTKGEIT